MPCAVLSDVDVRALAASDAVAVMRAALRDAAAGELLAPPRLSADLEALSYVFTVGGRRGGPSGFRAYRSTVPHGDQLVAVWEADGRLSAIVVGDELGPRRTGALGGAAIDALAPPDASTLAVIGSGRQAFTQLWAATAVRRLADIRIFSPTPAHRERFAARAADELGLTGARPVETAEAAAEGADVVILASRSPAPVIDPGAIGPGTHVTTVGPKAAGAHELPLAIVERAAVVCSDSPAQAAAHPGGFFTDRPLTHLGAILAGDAPGRTNADEITLYCSVGLAGTEVLLAERLLRSA